MKSGLRAGSRSGLSLILGQEIIYLIMAVAVAAAIYFAMLVTPHMLPEKEPPIIVMRDTDGFTFATGSAEISPRFRKKIEDEVASKIRDFGGQYNADILEIIGHTDEIPLRTDNRAKGNLDRRLAPFLSGKSADLPIASDNVGLGMARAVAVARILKRSGLDKQFQIIPLSAGAFQRTDDSASTMQRAVADKARRRIVIRLRRKRRD